MTSEGQHRPGQEPDEVPPGAAGPAPYGDRQAQPAYGNPAAPDLGWAPPPPTGRPEQPPTWAAPPDQPPTWAAPVPASGDPGQPGGWAPNGGPQPVWGAQPEQPAAPNAAPQPAWAVQAEQQNAWAAAPAAGQATPASVGRAQHEQAAPAWTPPESGARGAARVPQPAGQPNDGWPAQADPNGSAGWNTAPAPQQPATNGWPAAAPQDDPARSGGWPAPSTQDDPGHSGGWQAGGREQNGPADWNDPPQQSDVSNSGGWNDPQQSDVSNSGGWNAPQQSDAGDSAQWNPPPTPEDAPRTTGRASVPVPPQQDAPAWAQADNGTRGVAQAQQADSPAAAGWGEDDPARSGGWNAGAQQDQGTNNSWSSTPQQAERAPQPWAPAEEPAPARWDAGEAQQQANSWGTAAVPGPDDQPQDARPTPDEPARTGSWGAPSVPQQDDRPQPGGWTPPEQPARATASMAAPDGPPAWGADLPVVPDADPWAPGEAWGRAEAGAAQPPAEDAWEPQRADSGPIYQPGPAPGISPANKVPLPPQEQRVPGASLAAAPPADYVPPTPFGGPAEQPSFGMPGREGSPGGWAVNPPQSPASSGGWAADPPQSPAGPAVPAPRTSPEAEGAGRAAVPAADGADGGAVGRASASASVPMASRVVPPTDQALPASGTAAPQPRVYGRPTRPEHTDAQAEEPGGHQPAPEPRFDDQDRTRFDGQSHFDEPERPGGPYAFGGEAPSSAPPTSPAAPPAFPGAIPAFPDPSSNTRPMNGTRPHGPGERPVEPFGAPSDPAVTGPAPVPGYGHPAHDPAHGGAPSPFAPATQQFPQAGQSPFPPAGQQFPPAGQQPFPPAGQSGPGGWPQDPEPDQGRFNAFKPEAEPKAEQPAPKVRNGRVLAIVLIAAILILAVPLGLLMLLGKIGGNGAKPVGFNPAVGSCVKRSGSGATAANCGEPDAFTVVSRVDNKDKCTDPTQPHVVLKGNATNPVLCLKKAS
ncbi:hypothetical protein [Micromonospora sp. KC723]|uniref:LppU/SCO3897 family protein n=1 Tax=Micromonospora sp. KC723 TaxID=2530381 RepID=UPI0010521BC8|nr:hypothetical protein [Micromonospora sp. KC723]TDB75378.1 hypothetical protein E1165_11405 [Micromonospora sp. KC723]